MIDIFIKSYGKDFCWLRYCLKSIEKFVKYNRIIILIDEQDKHLFDIECPPNTYVHTILKEGDGYIFQQYCKLIAHHYTDSEYILFTDSDFCFNKKIDLQDLLVDGKPQILYTPYEKVGNAICWQEPTEKIMGDKVDFEFMRRLPLVYHRTTLVNFEAWFPFKLKAYITSQKMFSEFNALGAYAWLHENEKYRWLHTSKSELPEVLGIQSHSWSEWSEKKEAELKALVEDNFTRKKYSKKEK